MVFKRSFTVKSIGQVESQSLQAPWKAIEIIQVRKEDGQNSALEKRQDLVVDCLLWKWAKEPSRIC